ncbi:MAG: glucosaminidase domain-containing protein [Elusimicrobiota bacterium]|nr:glucosaminidase domain-containing protein [Elusimicrobiota bacterium]
MVKIYYQEGKRENIRPDMAFAQSLLETGYFKFPAGGDVKINQNNFAGLGATGKGARGAKFKTIREGVRAQIQHLKAYTSKKHPKAKVVDPRYYLLYNDKRKGGKAKTWNDLTGKWAVDPKYGDKITAIYDKILEQ